MRKIIFFMFLFIGMTAFTETVEKMSYGNGVLKLSLKERKHLEPLAKYSSIKSILELELPNTKLNPNILKALKVNDQYIEGIEARENFSSVLITFQMKPDIEYNVVSREREIKVDFNKRDGGTAHFNNISLEVKNTEAEKPAEENYQSQKLRDDYVRKEIPKGGNTRTGSLSSGRKYTVVIDAGHGGHDSGALGNGYQEKKIALAVSEKLARNLSQDYNVIMTRDSDYFIALSERAGISSIVNADLFISIHLNSGNYSANGAEVFVYQKNGTEYASRVARFENTLAGQYSDISNDDLLQSENMHRNNREISTRVATDILNNLTRDLGVRRRGVFGANFAVLRRNKVPAVLVELGFITNYNDISKFITEAGQERAAKSIAEAVRKNFR